MHILLAYLIKGYRHIRIFKFIIVFNPSNIYSLFQNASMYSNIAISPTLVVAYGVLYWSSCFLLFCHILVIHSKILSYLVSKYIQGSMCIVIDSPIEEYWCIGFISKFIILFNPLIFIYSCNTYQCIITFPLPHNLGVL